MRYREVIWEDKLDEFGRSLLRAMDYETDRLPTDHNPIVRALSAGDFVERYGGLSGFNMTSVSKVAIICQMAYYDANDGPESDGKGKGLRRQWYAWFKTRFAQAFSSQYEDGEFNGLYWAGRMSTVYGSLVDNDGLTYKDLWVDDASRMLEKWWETLFEGFNVVVAVEKDSLFGDFKTAAHALGAKSLVSGKGKQSKAATEKMLREHFSWRGDYNPFDEENPLVVLHISDHDCDGEAIIGPTFGEQARRYTPNVLEARVGIRPEQMNRDEWAEHWYEVKTSNKGYIDWAEREAVFKHDCTLCWQPGLDNVEWLDVGTESACPSCGHVNALAVKVDKEISSQPYGFEVEALPTRAYARLLVDALLTVVPFDLIVSRLRDECTASARNAAQRIQKGILERNAAYQRLLAEFDRLEEIKQAFEDRIEQELGELGQPHIHDWRDDDDDPVPDEYKDHVAGASDWTGPWRPFDENNRTNSLVEWLEKNEAGTIQGFVDETIEW